MAGRSSQRTHSAPHLDMLNLPSSPDNPKLQQLKEALHNYYNSKSKEGGRLKAHLYASLQTLLFEATFTQDRAARSRLIDKVHAWYLSKVQKQPSNCQPIAFQTRVPVVHPVRTQSALPRPQQSPVYPRPRPVEMQQLRETQAFKQTVGDWRRRSSRWQEERSRRLEQKHYFKREEVTDPRRPRHGSAPLFDFRKPPQPEAESPTAHRVVRLRRLHSQVLDVEVPVYNQASSGSLQNSYEAMSARNNLSNTQRAQVKEILEVKHKLASRSISCSLRDLENGLLLPDVPVGVLPLKFPRGGEQLLSNPFGNTKKKTAKKKKKKKKK